MIQSGAPVNFRYPSNMQQPSKAVMEWATTAGMPTPTGPQMRNVAHGGKRSTKKRSTKKRSTKKRSTRKRSTRKHKMSNKSHKSHKSHKKHTRRHHKRSN